MDTLWAYWACKDAVTLSWQVNLIRTRLTPLFVEIIQGYRAAKNTMFLSVFQITWNRKTQCQPWRYSPAIVNSFSCHVKVKRQALIFFRKRKEDTSSTRVVVDLKSLIRYVSCSPGARSSFILSNCRKEHINSKSYTFKLKQLLQARGTVFPRTQKLFWMWCNARASTWFVSFKNCLAITKRKTQIVLFSQHVLM